MNKMTDDVKAVWLALRRISIFIVAFFVIVWMITQGYLWVLSGLTIIVCGLMLLGYICKFFLDMVEEEKQKLKWKKDLENLPKN